MLKVLALHVQEVSAHSNTAALGRVGAKEAISCGKFTPKRREVRRPLLLACLGCVPSPKGMIAR